MMGEQKVFIRSRVSDLRRVTFSSAMPTKDGGMVEWPILFVRHKSLVVICDGCPESEKILMTHPIPKAQPFYWKPSQRQPKVLSLGEMERINYGELELPLPDLLSPSEVLEEEHIKELYTLLPARAVGYPWTRVFSTSYDGFSLKSLYRKMTEFDSPVILVIQDTAGAVFGALLSYPLRPSDSFYGTGESFLFTFHPSFKVFKWTGNNDYFVKGNMDSLSIGASEGYFGLWFDGDLNRGASVHCQTYNNDTLASSSDFVIKTLEAWAFA